MFDPDPMDAGSEGSNGRPWVLPVPGYVAKPDERRSLIIRRKPGGKLCWVRAMQATIDFMGWEDEFEDEITHKAKHSATGRIQFRKKGFNRTPGGKPMTIWRGLNRHRRGPQSRHRFRVSNCTTLFDVAELAHFTKCDWHWMTSPSGEVRSREQWDAIYQAGK